ncbi:MAG: CHASE2 domain-containing protein, partial [Proteobacteria bacterium]|nr:CHASE2 domain-containing protein [Pseudomonadota bacterium]
MTRRQLRTHIIAICIGLFCTLAVTAAYCLGRLDWLESRSLDLRFLYANSMSEADNIRCIDIDDEALELVGRWPWSRDRQAAIIDVLAELGAKSILIDINWVEPQPLGIPGRNDAAAVADPTGVQFHEDDKRFPDLELSAALRRAGNTFLAVLFEAKKPEGENADAARFRVPVSKWLEQTDADPAALKSWWPDLFHAMIPDGQIQNQTTGKSQLWSALLYALGDNATMRGDFVTPQRVRPASRRVDEIIPVHFPIA